MHDGNEPWRVGDLPYLEREINYWTVSRGYAACAAGVERALAAAARHGMDQVMVLPGWAARYEGALPDIVRDIDPAGIVVDCGGAAVIVMPTPESLRRFVAWCVEHVSWS